MKEFLTFRKSIAPVLIQIIYWPFTLAAFAGGLIITIDAAANRYRFMEQGIPGLLLLILGPVAVRLWAEYMTAFFEMRSKLADLRDIAVREAYEREEEKQGRAVK